MCNHLASGRGLELLGHERLRHRCVVLGKMQVGSPQLNSSMVCLVNGLSMESLLSYSTPKSWLGNCCSHMQCFQTAGQANPLDLVPSTEQFTCSGDLRKSEKSKPWTSWASGLMPSQMSPCFAFLSRFLVLPELGLAWFQKLWARVYYHSRFTNKMRWAQRGKTSFFSHWATVQAISFPSLHLQRRTLKNVHSSTLMVEEPWEFRMYTSLTCRVSAQWIVWMIFFIEELRWASPTMLIPTFRILPKYPWHWPQIGSWTSLRDSD